MATLRDIISRSRGVGGVIEEKVTPIKSLSEQAGLQTPPTGAVGTYLVGGNINQQKMAGTPQQLQGAQTLQETIRRGVGAEREEETGEERRRRELQQKLQPLGESQARAQEFIQSKLGELEAGATAALATGASPREMVSEIPLTIGGTIPTDTTTLSTLSGQLKKFQQTGGADMESLVQINQILGRDVNSILTQDQIDQLLQTVDQTIISTAQKLPDTITVGDIYGQLGIGTDMQSLEAELGISPGTLESMSVTDFIPYVDQLARMEFERSKELGYQVAEGKLGAAELQLARQQGRELARSGVRASESQMADLNRAVEEADQIEFGGEIYTAGELLKDRYIGQLVQEYIDAPEDSSTVEKLRETEPEFTSFIDKYREAFKAASIQQRTGINQFREIQESNVDILEDIPLEVLGKIDSKLVSGKGLALQSEKLDPDEIGGVVAAVNSDEANTEEIIAAVTDISKLGGSFQTQLASLSADEALKLTTEDALEIREGIKDRTNYQKIIDSGDEDKIYQYFAGRSKADLERDIGISNWSSIIFGDSGNGDVSSLVDPATGKLKSLDQVKAELSNGVAPVTILGAIRDNIKNTSDNKVDYTPPAISGDREDILAAVTAHGLNPDKLGDKIVLDMYNRGILEGKEGDPQFASVISKANQILTTKRDENTNAALGGDYRIRTSVFDFDDTLKFLEKHYAGAIQNRQPQEFLSDWKNRTDAKIGDMKRQIISLDALYSTYSNPNLPKANRFDYNVDALKSRLDDLKSTLAALEKKQSDVLNDKKYMTRWGTTSKYVDTTHTGGTTGHLAGVVYRGAQAVAKPVEKAVQSVVKKLKW